MMLSRLDPFRRKANAATADAAIAEAFVEAPDSAALRALEHLVLNERISEADALRVATLAGSTQTSISTILDRLGLLPQSDMMIALAAVTGLPIRKDLPETDTLKLHPRLSLAFLKNRKVLPLALADGRWSFLLADPDDQPLLKALRLATGQAPTIELASSRDIETALHELEERDAASDQALYRETNLSDAEHLQELANNTPTISFVDGVFEAAIQRGATDIHVEPGERAGRLRLRVDGILVDQGPIPSEIYPGVVSRLKILAGMDVAERRLPQDGRIAHRGAGTSFDVRAATMPSVAGESMALRLLRNGTKPMALSDLGMPEGAARGLETGLKHRNGIVLVTGPTGSGKTTTLHAVLASINSGAEKIMTVENPVEIRVPGIVQIEAKPEIGLTFAAGLRSILRHDPDIIMVGEIRDAETASIAIQAALTGHLVLSTLHTNDAAASATRLIDMGVDPFLLRATLRLALAQRLVRTLCVHCAEPVAATPGEESLLGHHLALPDGETIQLRKPIGCPLCSRTGFKGRQAIFECAGPERLAAEISGGGVPVPGHDGMIRHGLDLARTGITTIEDVLRVVESGSA
jgi:type II secretory ATPase GspE/PulE/Tfp pilus assembly ATPase PilB-like protein